MDLILNKTKFRSLKPFELITFVYKKFINDVKEYFP